MNTDEREACVFEQKKVCACYVFSARKKERREGEKERGGWQKYFFPIGFTLVKSGTSGVKEEELLVRDQPEGSRLQTQMIIYQTQKAFE